ncbi:MAG: hypothetical protein JNM18_23465 [Planctomycetaceae bacterium]|nr:hypothetical protein [Planctomycetaceae bacterium]
MTGMRPHARYNCVFTALFSCSLLSTLSCEGQPPNNNVAPQPAANAGGGRALPADAGELFFAHAVYQQLGREGESINALAVPVLLPDLLTDADTLPGQLDFLHSIPKRNPVIFSSTGMSISTQMNRLAPMITIAAERTPEEEADYQALKAKLFLPGGAKTPPYKAYLAYAEKLQEIRDMIAKPPPTMAELNQLQMRETTLREEWRERPDSTAIETAALRFREFDVTAEVELLKAWKQRIAAETTPVIRWSDLADPAGWRQVSFSNAATHALLLKGTSKRGGAAQEEVFNVKPGDVSLSLRLRRVSLAHTALPADALTSRLWKSASLQISDGNDQQDTATELVPRLVSEIIVAKEIELRYADETVWDHVRRFLTDHSQISVGGLALADGAFYLLPGSVAVNRPSIVGVYVKAVPASPLTR